ncbi:MAG TPA: hypothetical protein VIK84_07515 [Haloplasmataceae bacterium]
MFYVLLVLGIVYGGLNILAGVNQIKNKVIKLDTVIMMIMGGLFIIISSILSDTSFYFLYLLILGLVLIQIASIINGLRMYGKLHISHHLLRLIITLTMVLLYIFK